ncbi:MAG: hypothetical protein MUF54_17935, partial [Polyangiaceae bacterium]|nr:hypothetical protein [Polyangiaceae bacterium]
MRFASVVPWLVLLPLGLGCTTSVDELSKNHGAGGTEPDASAGSGGVGGSGGPVGAGGGAGL